MSDKRAQAFVGVLAAAQRYCKFSVYPRDELVQAALRFVRIENESHMLAVSLDTAITHAQERARNAALRQQAAELVACLEYVSRAIDEPEAGPWAGRVRAKIDATLIAVRGAK